MRKRSRRRKETRKIDPADQEDVMEDTGARGSQEEQEGEAPKRVIFSDDENHEEVKVEP